MGGDNSRYTILLSGGLDSSACVKYYLDKGGIVEAIFIDYGQSAAKQEQEAVQAITHHYDIKLTNLHVNFPNEFGAGEVVGRNLLLISLAVTEIGRARSTLVLGIHKSTEYYDCGKPFFDQMNRLIVEMSEGKIGLSAPFLLWSKKQIVEYLQKVTAPISLTYSCERGGNRVCGECLSCQDRELLRC